MKDDPRPTHSAPRVDSRAHRNGCIPRQAVVLLADGDTAARQSMAGHLQQHGFTVIEAGSSVEAIEMAELKLPQLILLDIRLPDSDGVDALTQLKGLPATAPIPVVACGSLGLRHERNRCFAAGAADWIQRPATANEVLEVIEKHLLASTGKGRHSY